MSEEIPLLVGDPWRGSRADSRVPLTKGKIQIQSEGAEVFYRKIEVRPLE